MYESELRNVTPPRAIGLWRRGLDWIVPAPCLACGQSVTAPRRSLGLCDRCRSRLRVWRHDGCQVCGLELAAPNLPPGYRCSACRRRPPPYERLLAGWAYQEPLDASLLALKFRRLDYLGGQLGRALVERLGDLLGSVDVVTPVPLHWLRRLRRGFDQADLVATAIAAELGRPRRHLLRRWRPTRPQSRLALDGRAQNLEGAFAARRRVRRWAGRRVLLVDDVVTTGATLEAATRCLVAAGISRVIALTVARTPEPGA